MKCLIFIAIVAWLKNRACYYSFNLKGYLTLYALSILNPPFTFNF